MRREILTLALGIVLAGGAFSCSGGVDTKPPPADDDDVADDDDDGTTVTPTPSPTASTTPTPGLSGDPWTTTANPVEDSCSFGVNIIPYGNAGAATIGITQTNGTVVFDVGMNLNPNIGVGDQPSGTLSGQAFTQTYSYCGYNGATTYKYVWTWSGTFNATFDAFNDATVGVTFRVKNGDHRSTCAATVFDPFGDCSSPGTMQYSVDGVKQ